MLRDGLGCFRFSWYDKDINTSGQFNMVNKNLTVICS